MEEKMLSLQEKMVMIRTQIPALVKRAYSEDVNYDFTKIDDIFRHLTPAMNRYKVNWEIESETATVKDNLGNPIYVRYLERAGLWMYEADLVIRWINAERPEDSFTATVHAIGTHEMPEKAKGSGWTYALKYYLLDKYGIDQGGEDPDMRQCRIPDEEGFQPDIQAGYEGDEKNGRQNSGDADVENPWEDRNLAVNEVTAQSGEEGREEEKKQNETRENRQNEVFKSQGQEKVKDRRLAVSNSLRPQNGRMVEFPESTREVESEQQQTGNCPMTTGRHSVMQEAAERQPDGEPIHQGEAASQEKEPAQPVDMEEAELEAACRIVCNIGIDKGKTLGELARNGAEGLETLEWIAYTYKGKNEALRQGAKLILESVQKAA